MNSYLRHPVLIHSLPKGQQSVRGVTILGDEVFLVRRLTPGVEVYAAGKWTLTRRLDVSGLEQPWDLTSCRKFRCLYIAEWGKDVVHRVSLTGETTQWKVNDGADGLSVAADPGCHVIVTCGEAQKLKEFTTGGDLVREVVLQDDLLHPWHAVLRSGDRFVVCHGVDADPLQRVCVVDFAGRVARSYGGPPGSAAGRLSSPLHVAVDEEGNVLVADRGSNRVVLLNEKLSDVRELVGEDEVKRSPAMVPRRLWLDEMRGLLLVSDGENKDVLIFQVMNV